MDYPWFSFVCNIYAVYCHIPCLILKKLLLATVLTCNSCTKMRGQPRHNTRPHARLPPRFFGQVIHGCLHNRGLVDVWSTGAGIKCLYSRCPPPPPQKKKKDFWFLIIRRNVKEFPFKKQNIFLPYNSSVTTDPAEWFYLFEHCSFHPKLFLPYKSSLTTEQGDWFYPMKNGYFFV